MQKILVVEDDWELNESISYMLEQEGYAAVSAHSVKEARASYEKEEPQLILLDVNLPDTDGFSFCRWLKDYGEGDGPEVPVLFLTARDLEEDVLKGYELGAQDYVTKPFSMKILLKRIDVILKRTVEEEGRVYEDGFLKVDIDRAKVEVDGVCCAVTPTEFRLLQEFLANRGQLLTYNILLERLWDSGGQFVDKHTLAVNINRLRGKIEDAGHKYISNVYGMGYQWLG